MSRFKPDDPYSRRAKKDGFAARSVYKLQEIDRKHRLFRKGSRVLDIGCAPGSWLQYIAKRIGPDGIAVGIDLSEVTVQFPEQVTVIRGDIYSVDLDSLRAITPRFDAVVSDAAPKTTGVVFADHARSVELVRRSFQVAEELLRPGGSWVAKVFQGEDIPELRNEVRGRFQSFSELKPKGSRNRSVEIFLFGSGFKKQEPEGDR